MEYKDVLLELINYIKEVSPDVWEIVVKQAYINAIFNFGWTIVLSVLSFLSTRFYIFANNGFNEADSYDRDGWLMLKALSIGAILLTTILAIAFFLEMVGMLLNPQYKAIQLLLDLAKGAAN